MAYTWSGGLIAVSTVHRYGNRKNATKSAVNSPAATLNARSPSQSIGLDKAHSQCLDVDDADDASQNDHRHRRGGAQSDVEEAEQQSVGVQRQRLRAVDRTSASHREDHVKGPDRPECAKDEHHQNRSPQ